DQPVPWGGSSVLPPSGEPGDFSLNVELAQVACDGSVPPGPLPSTTVVFHVADTCGVLPPLQLPYVQRVYTEPAHPTSRETTSVVLEGVFPYPCWQVIHRSNMPISLELVPTVCLPGLPTSWREVFPIGLLATGHHQVAINLTVDPPAEHSGDFSSAFQFVVDDTDTTVTP